MNRLPSVPFAPSLPLDCLCLPLHPEQKKAVNSISVDPKGVRMATGGRDGECKLWNFEQMNMDDPQPFNRLIPVEGHSVISVSFSTSGRHLLVLCSDAHARIYDRDGKGTVNLQEKKVPLVSTRKGDQYLRHQLDQTRGHTHMISGGMWHPCDATEFLTCSFDCTVRLWDINAKPEGFDQEIPMLHCLKCVDKRGICGGKGCMDPLYVSCASYGPDGKVVVAGCSDGSLQVFHKRNRYNKPDYVHRTAHEGGEVVSILFVDNSTFLTRGTDKGGSVKMWKLLDIKRNKACAPVREWGGDQLSCFDSRTNMCLSPSKDVFMTGNARGNLFIASLGSEEQAELRMQDGLDTQVKEETPETPEEKKPSKRLSLVSVTWHPSLNQVFCSYSDGMGVVLMDSSSAGEQKGALAFMGKKAEKKMNTVAAEFHINYEELKEHGFKELKDGEVRRIKRRDPVKQAEALKKSRDQEPVIHKKAATHLFAKLMEKEKETRFTEEDSQKTLLRFQEEALKNPEFFGEAYGASQPSAILDQTLELSEGDKLLRSERRYCPRCGAKICTCGYMKRLREEEEGGEKKQKR